MLSVTYIFVCSCCGFESDYYGDECPKCGGDMDDCSDYSE